MAGRRAASGWFLAERRVVQTRVNATNEAVACLPLRDLLRIYAFPYLHYAWR